MRWAAWRWRSAWSWPAAATCPPSSCCAVRWVAGPAVLVQIMVQMPCTARQQLEVLHCSRHALHTVQLLHAVTLNTCRCAAGLRKRLAPAAHSNASQPSMASPPTSSLNFGAHCAIRWALEAPKGSVCSTRHHRLWLSWGVLPVLPHAALAAHLLPGCCWEHLLALLVLWCH